MDIAPVVLRRLAAITIVAILDLEASERRPGLAINRSHGVRLQFSLG